MKNTQITVKNDKLKNLFADMFPMTEDIATPQISLPIMKLVYKSQDDTLNIIKDNKIFVMIGDKEIEVGTFYHSETKKSYVSPEIVILNYIKAKLPSFKDPSKLQHNELIGGWLLEDKQPFMAFIKGLALHDWWNFNGDLAQVSTDNKIPTFGLKAKFVVGHRDSMDGLNKNIPIPTLQLTGEVVTNVALVKQLADGVEKTKQGLLSFVDFKKGELLGGKSEKLATHDAEVLPETIEVGKEDIDPDDLPDIK